MAGLWKVEGHSLVRAQCRPWGGGGEQVPKGWGREGAQRMLLRSGDKLSCHSLERSLLGLGVVPVFFFFSFLLLESQDSGVSLTHSFTVGGAMVS